MLGGDIILSAQGVEIGTLEDLIAGVKIIRDQPPDGEVRIRVLRGGQIIELTRISDRSGAATSPR